MVCRPGEGNRTASRHAARSSRRLKHLNVLP
jgi:hypothetical protein